ncbi:MAG TPA: biotin-dependent carboxyltransferase family protein [Opitutaceae bacterium]
MALRVVHPGLLTTVQDLGRRGHLGEGVPVGGAADSFALRVANLLVGNSENTAGLEITLNGPELAFDEPAWLAVCGARFEDLPAWRPFRVEAGGAIRFGRCVRGCRGYLAVAGGVAVDPVLDGRGTFLAAGLGGFKGRALREGDVLAVGPSGRQPIGNWTIDERILPHYSAEPWVRVLPGAQASDFGDALRAGRYAVTSKSDRMGIRLDGPALSRSAQREIISSAVAPGTVQVPPDGRPIILLADAQTIGGYPRIAHVATVDLPLLAQLAPGDGVRFAASTLAEAHALVHAREHDLGLLRQGLTAKFSPP